MERVNFKCPVTGCKAVRKQNQVMCRNHWYQVPAALRTKIWNLFTHKPGSDPHRSAVAEAIQSVNTTIAARSIEP